MEAKESMIGDWVLIGNNHIRITSLQEGKDYVEAQPIPLTAEILEKNGFKVNKEREMVLKLKDYDIGIDFYLTDREEPLKSLYWYSIKKNNPIDGLMPLHYAEGYYSFVHELQHALSLCGIDKEIVL